MRNDTRARRTKKATYGAPEHPTAAYKSRHARKCSVCNHPDLEFINEDYLRWRSPEKIAREYGIAHHSAVYRHAAAMGLRHERRATLRATLENFIERADSVRVTAASVIRAAQAYAQINDDGQWNPTPRRHIVEYRHATDDATSIVIPSEAAFRPTRDLSRRRRPRAAGSAPKSVVGGSPTTAANSAPPQARAQRNSSLVTRRHSPALSGLGEGPLTTRFSNSELTMRRASSSRPRPLSGRRGTSLTGPREPISNREPDKLKHTLTPSKPTAAPHPNREL